MTNGNEPNNFEEITLAIALLGGIIGIFLYIREYFNNNVVDADSQVIQSSLVFVSALLVEFLIILLFFLLRGISIYAKPESLKLIKDFTQKLFTFSFIYFLLYIIAFISTFIFINFIYYNIELSNRPVISNIFLSILIILLVIVGLVLWDYGMLKSLHHIYSTRPSFGELWTRYKTLLLLLIVFIVILFLIPHFVSLLNLLSLYSLIGSYSIDVFPQSNANNDTLTFTIKETGISYNHIYIELNKLNADGNLEVIQGPIDNVTINYTNDSKSNKTFMFGRKYNSVWFLNINASFLQPGNYLLHAEVTDDTFKNFTSLRIRKSADKLFYIPPLT